MSLTIVLSGPKAVEPQLRTALAAGGCPSLPIKHDHGLAALPTGESSTQPVAFVTVEADDLDRVVSVASTLGYALRLHHETLPDPEPSAEMQLAATLADMRREIDELKARIT